MTDDLAPVFTADDLAARYGIGRRYVMDKARSQAWPHMRVGRGVRFTAEQVSVIDQMQSVDPSPTEQHAASWGRRTRRSA